MDNFDQAPPVPLTLEEQAHHRAEAEKGRIPTLDIVRRWIATVRKGIAASPTKVAKTKVSRNKVAPVTEDQVDFF